MFFADQTTNIRDKKFLCNLHAYKVFKGFWRFFEKREKGTSAGDENQGILLDNIRE